MKNVSDSQDQMHVILATPTVCVKYISLVFTIKKNPVSVFEMSMFNHLNDFWFSVLY